MHVASHMHESGPAMEGVFGLSESIKPFAANDLNSLVTPVAFRSLKAGRGEIALVSQTTQTTVRMFMSHATWGSDGVVSSVKPTTSMQARDSGFSSIGG